MNIRLMVIGALGIGLALSQAACGPVTPSGAPAPSPAKTTTTNKAKTKTKTEAPKSSGGGGSAQSKDCRNDDLAATVTLQPARADGAMRGLVAVVNTGKQSCKLEGRAAITLVNAADEAVDVPTREVDEPGAAVRITLRPGTSAFEGIKWTTCDKGDETCGVGNTLRFNVQASTDGPPARLDGFPAPEKSAITMKSLQVGTLQPLTQGVVAW
ncbi:DUF4232 domain-containing protein [Actinoplanes sp. NPDC049265]|uniref:DUF4232 domain-containing protein n=1 Tax=Actinoplanes sp. NPDC049265 TaxID=3363902 RepID=UPI0037112114